MCREASKTKSLLRDNIYEIAVPVDDHVHGGKVDVVVEDPFTYSRRCKGTNQEVSHLIPKGV